MGWVVSRLNKPHEKKVSLGELIDAIESNGLPQASYKYWGNRQGSSIRGIPDGQEVEIFNACALGQGALNLGMGWKAFENALEELAPGNRVISLNDYEHKSIKEIVSLLRENYSDRLNMTRRIKISYNVVKEA